MKHFEEQHKEHCDGHSALTVNEGIDKPPIVNPYFRRHAPREFSVEQYIDGILRGDITILSQAITLVESTLPAHAAIAEQIIATCLPHAGRSVRVGITGVPGAGKSTFIEAVGQTVVDGGRRLAVLAIDPSSQRSRGSILGDKTRMESISHNPNVFIRPSPSGSSLGGVARKTRETMLLCEAAGFDTIFIETVGVGQSETAVHSMVDLFLMLQISGAGDELQGIKRGIMEMADIIAINKCDGSNIDRSKLTKAQIEGALQLFPMPDSGIRPKVYLVSSTEGTGLKELWSAVQRYLLDTKNFDANRAEQATYWMYETINEALRGNFYHDERVEPLLVQYAAKVRSNEMSPFTAAHALLDLYDA